MIKVECDEDTREASIAIAGNKSVCELEFHELGKKTAEEFEELASIFILGMSEVLPKEKIQKYVDSAYMAQENLNSLKDFFDTLLKKLKEREVEENGNE